MKLSEIRGLLEIAERDRQGLEWLVGLLLQQLQGMPGYSDEHLLEAVVQGYGELAEHDPADPAIEPYVRLEVMLRSRLGEPVDASCLPRGLQAGYPAPGGAALRMIPPGPAAQGSDGP